MRLIVFGPPGAGKGTQAARLCKEKGLLHISTGDVLRSAIVEGTDLGVKAKSFMDKGDYVPDEVVIGIIKERLGIPEAKQGFVLDGFPRTMVQAETLDHMLEELQMPITHVVVFNVDKEAVVTRIGDRRVCASCNAVFSLSTNPPKAEGLCDHCHKPLVQREDDTREKIIHRLNMYQEKTADTVKFYRDKGLVNEVSAMDSIDGVYSQILNVLEAGHAAG